LYFVCNYRTPSVANYNSHTGSAELQLPNYFLPLQKEQVYTAVNLN